MAKGLRRAVFVDRDGVICRNRHDHVKGWEQFVFLPGALDALARLARSDLYIVIVTNQAIINRQIVPAQVVDDIHTRMTQVVEAAGGRIDRISHCPHRPDELCSCRKPEPGMILHAAEQLGIDVSSSYMIGDAVTDVMAGRAAGCAQCYLVLTGRGIGQLVGCWSRGVEGFRVVPNLGTAVDDIICYEDCANNQSVQFFCRPAFPLPRSRGVLDI